MLRFACFAWVMLLLSSAGYGGAPPSQALARINDEGKVELHLQVQMCIPKQVEETYTVNVSMVDSDGNVKQVPEVRTRLRTVTACVTKVVGDHHDLATTKFFEIDGRSIALAVVGQRLAKPTLVLVTSDGKMVPRYYATIFKPGTIVVATQPQSPSSHAPPQPVPLEAPPAPPGARQKAAGIGPAPLHFVAQVDPPAASELQLPNAPAPGLRFGRVAENGEFTLRHHKENEGAPRTIQFQTEDDEGRPATREASVRTSTVTSTTTYIHARALKFQTADGKPISERQLPQVLPKEWTVLVSYDGKPVDPFWLQNVKAETLVVRGPDLLTLSFSGGYGYAPPAPPVEHPAPVTAPPRPQEGVPQPAPAIPAPAPRPNGESAPPPAT